ncbi:hypothetical protein F9B85_11705 [Heliorestis acidaminivorans]|uniref:PD-(D/E)XK endonuclease-like domain-containing protein n=1 Tax=Heliorestis acidaminivorans TaxID=553427 RepID=A0A6I0EP71_9FIRM|nr:hypothetical protein [Heliorestis acidaminivorans]KAB2951687.1 hypothetical protein F9B85_11705 [Heliorestis acidaminivorans]
MPELFTVALVTLEEEQTMVLLLALLILAMLFGAFVFSWLRKLYQRWLILWRQQRGKRGETKAVKVLSSKGYTVIEAQPVGTMTLRVDGRANTIKVRADYLVSRQGKKYIAEVKTGQVAPRPTFADTRRQLLEYYYVYQVDGILLVDMTAERIHRIEFL